MNGISTALSIEMEHISIFINRQYVSDCTGYRRKIPKGLFSYQQCGVNS
ncbi:hypothetical protein [Peribacillus frigoritolerans]|nr:hypothetical protein [Peribacillus frigoritolerans]USK67081.1 hypothetical protein LIT26_10960 [Peribacillus frigoritolerans]